MGGHMRLFSHHTDNVTSTPNLVYPTFSDISIIIYFSSPHLSFFWSLPLLPVSLSNPFLCLRHSTFRVQKIICCIRHIQVIFISLLQYDFSSLFLLHILCFGK